jgi:hypothetical protein
MFANSSIGIGWKSTAGPAAVLFAWEWSGGGVFEQIDTSGNFEPGTTNSVTSGAASLLWKGVYATGYFAGAGATAGVTCAAGSPTASFAAVGGIVTHC